MLTFCDGPRFGGSVAVRRLQGHGLGPHRLRRLCAVGRRPRAVVAAGGRGGSARAQARRGAGGDHAARRRRRGSERGGGGLAAPLEPWFCFEQPDRDRAALGALGTATALEASGPDRFKVVAKRWRMLASHAACDPPDGPRGCGPIAVGGFAFAPEGGRAPHWAGYRGSVAARARGRPSCAAGRTCG